MCGIIGYIGYPDKTKNIILDGLSRLEYRGYDSSGIAIINGTSTNLIKSKGKISNLLLHTNRLTLEGSLGIGHTRWATHGTVTEANTHPHGDCTQSVFVVHNGIIENYRELKEMLMAEGHFFGSETDTEVLAHLIEKHLDRDIAYAVRLALQEVKGTWGIAVVSKNDPEKIVVARKSSPLLIGVGDEEHIVASDASPLFGLARKVIYLNDGEVGTITPSGLTLSHLDGTSVPVKTEPIARENGDAGKGVYAHFMLKEIFEQPESLKRSLGATFTDLGTVSDQLGKTERFVIVGCGTAYLAGLIGEYLFEEYAGIPAEVELASEFRYRKPVLEKGTTLLCISQSGETADTLAALAEAKGKGITTLGIVNTHGSSLARETDAVVYNRIGPEIGVASTKAFTSQIAILARLAFFLGKQRGQNPKALEEMEKEFTRLPALAEAVLSGAPRIRDLAKKYHRPSHFLYLGRKYNYPVALEGALKLKEISYIHAEGYSAGEMKHGPLALIDETFPTIAIALSDSVYEKMWSNMEEIRARNGRIVAIATEGNRDIEKIADDVIFIPRVTEALSPILSVIPLQLFAYFISTLKGLDPDKPRNLAKSVTVE